MGNFWGFSGFFSPAEVRERDGELVGSFRGGVWGAERFRLRPSVATERFL